MGNLISVIIPVYNGEKYIQETFDSIRNQTYTNYELVVVDGNSKDRTVEIIEKNRDIITRFISEDDNGMYDALNKGARLSTGDIMCYINSDDRLVKNALQLVNAESEVSRCDLYFGDINFIDEQGKYIYASRAINMPATAVKYLRRLPFAQQSAFWTRRAYDLVGGFDSTLKYVADSKFFFSLYFHPSVKRAYISSVLGEFRMHSDSFSIGSSAKMQQESKSMRESLKELRYNWAVRMFFESFVKIKNIKNIYLKKRYKGTTLG